jgi:hypothetical protein
MKFDIAFGFEYAYLQSVFQLNCKKKARFWDLTNKKYIYMWCIGRGGEREKETDR